MMDKKKLLVIVIVLLLLLGLAAATKIFFLDRQTKSIAALRVDSFPTATVYLDNKAVGQTPYSNQNLTEGEYRLKLVATGVAGNYFPWETKIKLTQASLTYVSRDIGADDDSSGGQILWLEGLTSDTLAELAIMSDPQGATIKIDGNERGIAPMVIKDLPKGDHEILLSLSNHSDQVIKARVIAGFRLNAAVKLAKLSQQEPEKISTPSAKTPLSLATPSAKQKVEELPRPYVIISETGVGFLRVRSAPSTTATESARVKPGEKYPLVSEVEGWVKINYASSSGWVSDKYVQKVK